MDNKEKEKELVPKEVESILKKHSFYVRINDNQIEIDVADIEVTNPISDVKSVYLKTKLNSFEGLNINDTIFLS